MKTAFIFTGICIFVCLSDGLFITFICTKRQQPRLLIFPSKMIKIWSIAINPYDIITKCSIKDT